MPLLRLQLDEQQADRRQGQLSPGEYLGVADRPLQRQLHCAQADPADAVRFVQVAHSCHRLASQEMRWIIRRLIDTVQFIKALD